LTGALLLLPRVLAYTAFVTWTFRGKIADGGGYR
jgi:cytochrome bd-type quinol oxidase subunit 2